MQGICRISLVGCNTSIKQMFGVENYLIFYGTSFKKPKQCKKFRQIAG
jgi:hypothetical protein